VFQSAAAADSALEAMVGVWSPNWALLTRSELDDVPENWVGYSPDLGWKPGHPTTGHQLGGGSAGKLLEDDMAIREHRLDPLMILWGVVS
jgi:hypothetical protein